MSFLKGDESLYQNPTYKRKGKSITPANVEKLITKSNEKPLLNSTTINVSFADIPTTYDITLRNLKDHAKEQDVTFQTPQTPKKRRGRGRGQAMN